MFEFILDTAAEVWRQGGFVMWFLAPVTLLMWFGIGLRAWTLRRGMPLVDSFTALDAFLDKARRGKLTAPMGIVDTAAVQAVRVAAGVRGEDALRSRLEEAFLPLRDEAGSWAAVVKGAAIVAPLAGLLGTVTGMISTFDALGSGMMYTAGGGGIGAGVSEALVSTQSGLVVAVPGILLGALLARKQRQIEDELDQLIEKVCATGGAA